MTGITTCDPITQRQHHPGIVDFQTVEADIEQIAWMKCILTRALQDQAHLNVKGVCQDRKAILLMDRSNRFCQRQAARNCLRHPQPQHVAFRA